MMTFFEWDDDKARANLRKHGVSFEDATLIFDDPNMVTIKDREVGEQRWQAIGSARGQAVLLVVHTVNGDDENEDEKFRIISARRATRQEKLVYQSAHH